MTFCEARVQVGFPDYLLVDMGIFDLAAWFKAMRERLGDTQKVAEFEKIEVPGDLVIELIKGTKGRFHHRGLTERDIKLFADDAARLFKPDSTYTVELFEVYRGEHVPAGKKSLNFTVTLGAPDRTLSDKDESKFLDKVRKNAVQIGAELRG